MLDMEVLRQELWNSMIKHNKEASKDGRGYGALIDAAVAITLSEVIRALEKADK